MTEESQYPPEKSEGVNNTHIIYCDSLNRRSHYCICLNFLRAVDEKRITGFEDCQTALRNGTCNAVKPRNEEREAGKALYYTPRKAPIKAPVERPMAKGKRRPAFAPSKPVIKPVVKPKPPKEEQEVLMGSDMSEVINASINSKPIQPSLIKPHIGEDPIHFAKRYQQAIK
ncbi:MAG: hypothetical protein ABJG42_24525 [Vibrio splendidus]